MLFNYVPRCVHGHESSTLCKTCSGSNIDNYRECHTLSELRKIKTTRSNLKIIFIVILIIKCTQTGKGSVILKEINIGKIFVIGHN